MRHPPFGRNCTCPHFALKRTVGEEGLEPPLYYSGNMAFLSQDDAESDARFAELETLIENWSLLTTDDRRRIIAIVNGRLA